MDDNLMFMKKSAVFKDIKPEELEKMQDELDPVVEIYDRDEVIYREGEDVRTIGLVCKGRVRTERVSDKGDIYILDMYSCGETICLDCAASLKQTAAASYISSVESIVMQFYLERLMCCSFREKIMRNIIYIMANDSIKRLYKTEILSIKEAEGRIMAYLRLMEKKSGGNTFYIDFNREQMAQYLCINRSVLSAKLGEMKKKGLIDFKKDRFTIL